MTKIKVFEIFEHSFSQCRRTFGNSCPVDLSDTYADSYPVRLFGIYIRFCVWISFEMVIWIAIGVANGIASLIAVGIAIQIVIEKAIHDDHPEYLFPVFIRIFIRIANTDGHENR